MAAWLRDPVRRAALLGAAARQGEYRRAGLQKTEYPYDWHRRDTARRADGEAKRARHDRAFRARWLRRLARERARLLRPKCRTLAEVTAAADTYCTRADRVLEIDRLRTVAGARPHGAEPTRPGTGALLPVAAATARRAGAEIDMRGKNARIIPTRGSSHHDHADGETTWKGGRPVEYSRAVNDNYVRSFALLRPNDAHTIDIALHNSEWSLTLPSGYHWDIDVNGLRVVHGRDDYHPVMEELMGDDAISALRAAIAEHAAMRRRLAAERLAEDADARGVYVCLADSLRAGNCRAASETWAARHGISVTEHVSALQLLSMIRADEDGDDTRRAKLALRAAMLRHRGECERGYAVMSDHDAGETQ